VSDVYDAVVVGAGPAGASAAHVLAEGGARVLLVEKASMPRYKPCGGALSLRSYEASPLVAPVTPLARVGRLVLTHRALRVECPLPAPLSMVMRAHFDAYLTEHAIAAGATLRDGSTLSMLEPRGDHVRLTVGTDVVLARYVVGADGVNGVTGRLAGIAPAGDPAAALEVELAVDDATNVRYATDALFDLSSLRGGYGWIFPKGDHLSVGVGAFDPRGRRTLKPALARLLAHPDLARGKQILQRGHKVPLYHHRKARAAGRVVLAGDAASLVDPMTGEGICYALASGRMAGQAVLDRLGGTARSFAPYERAIASSVGIDLSYAWVVQTIAYRYPNLLLRHIGTHGSLRDLAVGAVGGTASYRQLAARLVKLGPTFLRGAL